MVTRYVMVQLCCRDDVPPSTLFVEKAAVPRAIKAELQHWHCVQKPRISAKLEEWLQDQYRENCYDDDCEVPYRGVVVAMYVLLNTHV